MREQSVIRNPLTVIAIFAGIAEVSGTIILPLLSEDRQSTFMWFVMGFPCLLVSMFFFTLWKKHQVLYAPSDFRDDSGFLEAQRGRRERAARDAKFIEDMEFALGVPPLPATIDEVAPTTVPSQAPGTEPQASIEPPTPTPTPTVTRTARGTYLLAERLVLDRLQKEIPGEFGKDTVLVADDAVYAFDATFQHAGQMLGVDVKYFPTGDFNKGLLRSQLSKLESFYKKMPLDAKREFKMIIAVATDAPLAEQRLIWNEVEMLAKRFSVPLDVRIYDMRSLEGDLGGR